MFYVIEIKISSGIVGFFGFSLIFDIKFNEDLFCFVLVLICVRVDNLIIYGLVIYG